MTAAPTVATRLRRALPIVAVGVAFADSSIVVLAVPEIVRELDVGVSGASWVITAYNVAVVAAGAALLPVVARLRPRSLAGVGFASFVLASVGCAAAPSFELLVAFRALQGAAAALVLVAALPLLGGRAGIRAWTVAATIGLAAGPALGGLLTELFTWRSIFVAQAPLVALGLLTLRRDVVVADGRADRGRGARSWLADATLAALSAALVGALFLVVVLLINGFGWQPLPAALVATTLPVLAAIAQRTGRRLPAWSAAAGGGLLVAAGLATLGFLPAARTDLIVAGLALCGAGLGLAADPLGRLALAGPRLTHDAAWTVVARHAGLVVSLVVVTPVLVSSLSELEVDAEAVGGELALRSPLPLTQKVPLMIELAQAADAAEAGLPDIRETLAPHETGEGPVARLADRLTAALHDLVARAFREAFLLCAGLGLLSGLLALGLGRAGERARAPAVAFLVLALAGAGGALTADFRLGALDDPAAVADPCRAAPSFQGPGVDETVRIALGALASAACELDTNRTALLRGLTGTGPRPWPADELAGALQTGLVEAIDAERERGTINRLLGLVLRTVVANAPVDWILGVLRGLTGRP